MTTTQPTFELWTHSNFFGAIVLQKTGVWWSNQVGGTACAHPKVEGFYVPIRMQDVDTYGESIVDLAWHAYDEDLVKEWLTEYQWSYWFEPIPADVLDGLLEPEKTIYEAWMPVRVRPDLADPQPDETLAGKERRAFWHAHRGRVVIFTWENSD
jgi:hypothetical protein